MGDETRTKISKIGNGLYATAGNRYTIERFAGGWLAQSQRSGLDTSAHKSFRIAKAIVRSWVARDVRLAAAHARGES